MQLYLDLFFSDSLKALLDIIISYFDLNKITYRVQTENNGTTTIVTELFVTWIDFDKENEFTYKWIKEDYNVRVNKSISFQLYPGCSEKQFSKFIKYLLNQIHGDFYLNSEWDDIILYRNDQLCIKKACWTEYLMS